jgi:hypothetical protein
MDLPSRAIPKHMKSKHPPLFPIFMAIVRTTIVTRTVPRLSKKKGVQCPATYIEAQSKQA